MDEHYEDEQTGIVAEDIACMLIDAIEFAIDDMADDEAYPNEIRPFKNGLLLKLPDGSQFHITVQQTRHSLRS